MALASTYLMDPTIKFTVLVGTVTITHTLTDQVSGVEISQSASVLKRTTFGNTWDRNGRGLKRGTIKLDFYVDFDADGVFDIFSDLWANHELVNFTVEAANGSKVAGTFVMSECPSFNGKIDEYNSASLTFTLDGPAVNTPES